MSSIDDLRSTLERHADGVADHDLHVRPVAVRERVRAVRRRRRSVAGGIAAVAVVAAVATTLSIGADRSAPVADRTLAGHVAPVTMTSLGYTYAFAQADQGDGRAVLELPTSDQPRLLSWATEGDDDRVVLRAPGERPRVLEADDFGDFTFVPPRSGGRFTLTGTGQVALAAYDLTDAAPLGDTSDGVTFRFEVAGQRLIADAIGEPGDADVDVDLFLGAGPLPISYLCSGGPRGAWVHVAVDGEQAVFGRGCDDVLFDPAGGGGYTTTIRPDEIGDGTVRIWVTDGEDGPTVDDPDVRLAVAAYAPARVSQRVAGAPVDDFVEHDGHLWRLAGNTVPQPGDRSVDLPDEIAQRPGEDTLVTFRFRRAGAGLVATVLDGEPGSALYGNGNGSGGGTIGVVPRSGGSAGVRARGDVGAEVELGLAWYVRTD
ncbi:MAG: hypothetical protein JWO76_108 [Nocardioides sp.]|nr:hypothetical protein [Nocardioides sp.]